MIECFECGGEMHPDSEKRPVKVGKREVVVDEDFLRCPSCGEEAYGPGQMNRSMQRASDAIRREDGLLSPAEILGIRTNLGLSQAVFENLLGVGRKTVVRWEKGTVFQNKATDQLLRVLRDVPGVARYLSDRQGVPLNPPGMRWAPRTFEVPETEKTQLKPQGVIPIGGFRERRVNRLGRKDLLDELTNRAREA